MGPDFNNRLLVSSLSLAGIAIAGALVYYLLTSREQAPEASDARALRVAIADLAADIASLEARVGPLEQRFDLSPAVDSDSDTPSLVISGLRERIESLEAAIVELEPTLSTETYREQEKRADYERYTTVEPTAAGYAANPRGEEAYATDLGKPLGHYAEEIPDALYSLDGAVSVRDVHCRTSVCRIAYSQTEERETQIDLAGHLSEALGNVDLDIHYARDESGQPVMYLQVR